MTALAQLLLVAEQQLQHLPLWRSLLELQRLRLTPETRAPAAQTDLRLSSSVARGCCVRLGWVVVVSRVQCAVVWRYPNQQTLISAGPSCSMHALCSGSCKPLRPALHIQSGPGTWSMSAASSLVMADDLAAASRRALALASFSAFSRFFSLLLSRSSICIRGGSEALLGLAADALHEPKGWYVWQLLPPEF